MRPRTHVPAAQLEKTNGLFYFPPSKVVQLTQPSLVSGLARVQPVNPEALTQSKILAGRQLARCISNQTNSLCAAVGDFPNSQVKVAF